MSETALLGDIHYKAMHCWTPAERVAWIARRCSCFLSEPCTPGLSFLHQSSIFMLGVLAYWQLLLTAGVTGHTLYHGKFGNVSRPDGKLAPYLV